MGNSCGGTSKEEREAKKWSHSIDQILKKDECRLKQTINVLMLSSSMRSDTATICKQIKLIHMDGFTEEERAWYRSLIQSNIFLWMRTLASECHDLEPHNADIAEEFKSRPVGRTGRGQVLNQEIADKVKRLWADPGIKRAFDDVRELCNMDEAPHFLDSIDRFVGDSFVVEDKDIFYTRDRFVSGVNELEFAIENCVFRSIDASGLPRLAKKKWMPYFEHVTAVFFFVPIDEFDICYSDDLSQNRLRMSIDHFADIMYDASISKQTHFVLMFTKRELFEEKLRRCGHSLLQRSFPDYEGNTIDDAVDFVRDKFVSQNKFDRTVMSHVVIASNTENIRIVFTSIKNSLLSSGFDAVGF